MEQKGFMLIGVKKSITLYLWANTEEELLPDVTKSRRVVPYYKDGNKAYLKIDEDFVRIS